MTLIEHYLAAVAAHLPRDRREDIVAELGDALAERVDAREAELGRGMTEAETEALLREFGHPLTVAARYRGGPDHLIGPELFPYWWFAVKAALVLLAVFVTVGAIGAAVVQGGDLGDVISEIISGLVNGGLTVVGIAALIGFALERQPNRPRFMTDWRVKDLELFRRWSLNGDDLGGGRFGERVAAMAAAPTRRFGGGASPVAKSLWRVAGWAVFLLWWVGVFTPGGLSPQEMLAAAGSAFSGVDYSEALSGLADPLYWPVIVYGLARIGLELARMAAPGAVRSLALGDLSLAGASAGLLYWVWAQSSLAPVARIDSLGEVIARISALVNGRFDLGHLLVLILIFNALEIAGRAIGALRRLATGRA